MLKLSDDHRSWRTIRRILQTHTYTTILLPTKNGKLYRIRKAGIPEACQQAIYDVFGINGKDLPAKKTVVLRDSKLATL
jgi:hypothetical protein